MPGFGGGGWGRGPFLDVAVASVPPAVAVAEKSKSQHLVFGGSGGSSSFIRSVLGLGDISPAHPTIL